MATPNVIELLMQDHREVEGMFAELEGLLGSADANALTRKKELTEQVTIELVKHSVAEEAEVYPRISERIDEDEAERLRHEQAEAELTMKALEKLNPDDPSFDASLRKLMQEISAHVQEEEQTAFPRMREVFTDDELVGLARGVSRVKEMAPTRPHPSAPDRPPGDLLLGPVTGLFDRLRDAVTGRGTSD